jgi:hypothetical protein
MPDSGDGERRPGFFRSLANAFLGLDRPVTPYESHRLRGPRLLPKGFAGRLVRTGRARYPGTTGPGTVF